MFSKLNGPSPLGSGGHSYTNFSIGRFYVQWNSFGGDVPGQPGYLHQLQMIYKIVSMCHERSFYVFHLWVRRVLRRRVGQWPRPASWGWASWETRASWRGCQPVCRFSGGSHPTPSHTRQAEPCSRNVDQGWQNWTVSICGPCNKPQSISIMIDLKFTYRTVNVVYGTNL